MLKKHQNNISFDKDSSFRNDRRLENLRRLNNISKIFIIYIIWLGCIAFYYLLVEKGMLEGLFYFAIVYIIFLIFNCAAVIISHKLLKFKNTKLSGAADFIVMASVFVIMLFGVVMTLMDQEEYGHLMVYFICVFCCMGYFLLSMREVVLPFMFSAVLLIVGLFIVQKNMDILIGHYINIALFLPVSFLLSRIIYRDYKSKYDIMHMLERETQRSKNLYRELDQANHILRKLSSIDELTGIANRRGLNQYLEISLEGSSAHKLPIFAAMVDIDCFKEYNDTYGHIKGDMVLKQVSEQLSLVAAKISGFAARWGGEEFIVVSCGITVEESKGICEHILSAIKDLGIEHTTSRTGLPIITVSIGVCSMFIRTQDEFIKCVECADKALYYAKQQGRNRYKHFDFTN